MFEVDTVSSVCVCFCMFLAGFSGKCLEGTSSANVLKFELGPDTAGNVLGAGERGGRCQAEIYECFMHQTLRLEASFWKLFAFGSNECC